MHNGVVQRPLCFYHCWQVGFSGLARAARLLRYLGVWFAGDGFDGAGDQLAVWGGFPGRTAAELTA